MMVDEPRNYVEPSPTNVIKEILGELETEGTVPTEAAKPFTKEVYVDGDHKEGAYTEVEHKGY